MSIYLRRLICAEIGKTYAVICVTKFSSKDIFCKSENEVNNLRKCHCNPQAVHPISWTSRKTFWNDKNRSACKKKSYVQMQSSAFSLTGAHTHMVHGYSVFVGSLRAPCWHWIFTLAAGEAPQLTWFTGFRHVRFVAAACKIWRTNSHCYIKTDLKRSCVTPMKANDRGTIWMK